jgi:hypothetical protein
MTNYEIINQIEYRGFDTFAQRKRHLLLRFDLHMPEIYPPCSPRRIFKTFINTYVSNRRSGGHDPRYLWCMERATEDRHPHWHLLFVFSARETTTFMNHLEETVRLWALALGIEDAGGLVEFCLNDRYDCPQRNGFTMQRGMPGFAHDLEDAVRMGSYLAKAKTKGLTELNEHEWGASHGRSPKHLVKPLEDLYAEAIGRASQATQNIFFPPVKFS